MHRSASTSRASDEYYVQMMSMGMGVQSPAPASRSASISIDQLPTYDPQSDVAKKEVVAMRGSGRLMSITAANMVHLIPLVLILCAVVLWFFSHPEIDVVSKDDSVIARIKNMTIDGYSSWNGTTMTIGMEDLDSLNGMGTEDAGRGLDSKDPK